MLIGFIADIHSNLPALRAVLEHMDVDKILCAGDVVGYYPYPNEVIGAMKKHKIVSIRGNHDVAVITGDTSWFNPLAASAVEWTRDNISPKNMTFLKKLPEKLTFGDIAIFHGSPSDPDEYVYPMMSPERLSGFLDLVGKKILVLGHTHVQWSLELDDEKIINPGAVGQPRDGDPRAAYAVFNTDSEELTMHRIEYDIDEVAVKTVSAGLPPYLAQRLFVGL